MGTCTNYCNSCVGGAKNELVTTDAGLKPNNDLNDSKIRDVAN